jgi:hypothetical protein
MYCAHSVCVLSNRYVILKSTEIRVFSKLNISDFKTPNISKIFPEILSY